MQSVNKIRGRIYLTSFVIAFILGLVGYNSPASATDVGGIIDVDTIWTEEDSPYVVVGNVLVLEGITLTTL